MGGWVGGSEKAAGRVGGLYMVVMWFGLWVGGWVGRWVGGWEEWGVGWVGGWLVGWVGEWVVVCVIRRLGELVGIR